MFTVRALVVSVCCERALTLRNLGGKLVAQHDSRDRQGAGDGFLKKRNSAVLKLPVVDTIYAPILYVLRKNPLDPDASSSTPWHG